MFFDMESVWMKRKIIRWMEDNRGLILTLFGLPLSFLFDQALQVRFRAYPHTGTAFEM
jgi:hypothetical protein